VVDVQLSEPRPDELAGHHLDVPIAGDVASVAGLDVIGWVLSEAGSAVRAVEIAAGDTVVSSVPINELRPDVARAYPDSPHGARCGYRASVQAFGTERNVELRVTAVLTNGVPVPLALIRGRRRWREDPDPSISSLVSIVIPCHNQAQFLAESIESALSQTYPNVEVVVVDDGSTDNTPRVVKHYPEVELVSQHRRGLSAARNTGLRCSSGSYVVFLDADDRLVPEAVARGLACIHARPERALTWGGYRLIDVDGGFLSEAQVPSELPDPYAALLERNVVEMHASLVYRRGLFEHVGGFDESLIACEDHDLLLRIVRLFPVGGHEGLVADYRQHGAAMKRDPRRMLRASMIVLDRQRPYIRQRSDYRHCYRRGKERNRESYGQALITAVVDKLRTRRWGGLLGDIFVLARYHPRGVLSVLRPVIRLPLRRR
jgi:glycosyltransferase involved in cell wall biosynthesis